MTQPDITQEEREKFCKLAYEYGHRYFKNSFAEYETQEGILVLSEDSYGKHSKSEIIRIVEDYYGFEIGKHDWDNFGIYGLIEDIVICYEAGAKDGLDNNEPNPERISHMWE
jgi:hypothetical protein